jgi:CubicO group peptidase (beta-lactamase class C family)
MEERLRTQLNGKTVGYAYVVGNEQTIRSGSGGLARTAADGAPVAFTLQTPVTVASVSKLITAVATMSVLRDHGVGLDDPIGPYFPSDWEIAPYVERISFAQLLSHTSGIRDFGNGPQLYDRLESLFTQTGDPNAATPCNGSSEGDRDNAITPSDQSRCYSNFNFGVLRILLPRVAGFEEVADPANRPRTLAEQYEQLVQEHVFEPIGVTGPTCQPNNSEYAFGYVVPGDRPGKDWGDVLLRCGDAGWYLSAEAMAAVVLSLNARDGRILEESRAYSSLNDMRVRGLGMDRNTPQRMEKDGLWADGVTGEWGGFISTSVVIYGPTQGPNIVAVLFVNSDIVDGPGGGAMGVLSQAYEDALVTR